MAPSKHATHARSARKQPWPVLPNHFTPPSQSRATQQREAQTSAGLERHRQCALPCPDLKPILAGRSAAQPPAARSARMSSRSSGVQCGRCFGGTRAERASRIAISCRSCRWAASARSPITRRGRRFPATIPRHSARRMMISGRGAGARHNAFLAGTACVSRFGVASVELGRRASAAAAQGARYRVLFGVNARGVSSRPNGRLEVRRLPARVGHRTGSKALSRHWSSGLGLSSLC